MASNTSTGRNARSGNCRPVYPAAVRLAVSAAKAGARAFTLIELIVVMILLSVLLYFLSQMSSLLIDDLAIRQTAHNQDILIQAIRAYYHDNTAWPPDTDRSDGGNPDKSGQELINALYGYCPGGTADWKYSRCQEKLLRLSEAAWPGRNEPVRDGYGNVMRYQLKISQPPPEWADSGLYNPASIVTYQGRQYICTSSPHPSERDAPPPHLPARWRLNRDTKSAPIIISPGRDGRFGSQQDTAAEQDDIRSDSF
ncbi:MAG: prepilin-type N-terminal cleavage/methylation domain-containing protein [Planctomycetes bacterium]|nr:prepilin-type N-terminal cleavage/methylation domain-containing protein [Planctomycetota bacterium]